jgi:hypothetical protein
MSCNCAGTCCCVKAGPAGRQGVRGIPGIPGAQGPTVVSGDGGNLVQLGSDGFLHLDQDDLCAAGFINHVTNSPTLLLNKVDCGVSGTVRVSATANNQVQVLSDGVFVAPAAMPDREFFEDILQYTFPQFTYNDAGNTYSISSVPASAVVGLTAGCGLTGNFLSSNPLRVNRVDLYSDTVTSSLEAGDGSCGLRVAVDGVSVKRNASGQLMVDFPVPPVIETDASLDGVGTVADPLRVADIPWIPFVPVVTQGANITVVDHGSSYTQIGKLVFVRVNVSLTSAGVSGNAITCTIPVPAVAPSGGLFVSDHVGGYHYYRGSVDDSDVHDQVILRSSSVVNFVSNSASGAPKMLGEQFITVATDSWLKWSGFYQAV